MLDSHYVYFPIKVLKYLKPLLKCKNSYFFSIVTLCTTLPKLWLYAPLNCSRISFVLKLPAQTYCKF